MLNKINKPSYMRTCIRAHMESMVITYKPVPTFFLNKIELHRYGKYKNNIENGISVVIRQTQNSPNLRASKTKYLSTSSMILRCRKC
jgi:hypothetical protein